MGGPAAIIAPPPIPEGALPDVSALSYLGFFPILLSLARSLRVRTSWLSAASVGRPTPRVRHVYRHSLYLVCSKNCVFKKVKKTQMLNITRLF